MKKKSMNKLKNFVKNVFPYIIGTALSVVVLWFSLIKPLIPFAKEVFVVAILVLLLLIFVTVDDWTS